MGALTYYPPPPASGLIPPFPAGWGEYTPGTPGFLALVQSLQGDAGDTSDGFDDAFALVSSAVDDMGDLMAAGDPTVDTIASAAADYEAITDEISTELEIATALYDTAEAGLLTAIAIQEAMGNEPGPFSIPGLPSLAAIALPDAFDLLGFIVQSINNALTAMAGLIEAYVQGVIAALTSPTATGGGGLELEAPADWAASMEDFIRRGGS